MRGRTFVVATVVLLFLSSVVGCHRPSGLSGPVTSKDDAVARVSALPDVARWIKLVQTDSPANRIVVEVDSEGVTTYTVHAYEFVQDDMGGHSATFGWYEVVKATGVVRSVMP